MEFRKMVLVNLFAGQQWKRLWCWEGLGAGGEGDNRGCDGWMASLTWWTWIWVNSGGWWLTRRPGVLRFMGSQSRTWLSNWTELNWVRKWSPITQIWTYLSEGTASQISKHVLSALGDFHPFSNMALDSRQYKTVIFQKEPSVCERQINSYNDLLRF